MGGNAAEPLVYFLDFRFKFLPARSQPLLFYLQRGIYIDVRLNHLHLQCCSWRFIAVVVNLLTVFSSLPRIQTAPSE
jgi:hypothetical protein